MSLKRTATTEGIPGPSAKLPKLRYYYVLESESEKPTDESSESEYSIQAKETDFAKDTSDTTTSDWSDGVALGGVEYDVASLSEKEHVLADGSLSSDSDYMVCGSRMVVLCDEKLSSFADSSGTSDSNLVYDPELPRADYWTCLRCKNTNNNPLFRYCEKCYKVRKSFFPPRPRKRRRRRKNSNKHAMLKKSSTTAALSEGLKKIDVPIDDSIPGPSGLSHFDSGLGSSQEFCSQGSIDSHEVVSNNSDSLSSETCITCLSNPKNGIFIHGNVGHICCCYKCALKVWNDNGKCPICNRKVSKVLKAIVQ